MLFTQYNRFDVIEILLFCTWPKYVEVQLAKCIFKF